MIYKKNIPQPTDGQDVSQNDLLNNFKQLDTSFGVDHIDYSDVSGDTGKHNTVTYVVQAAIPLTPVNEIKEFSFEVTANTKEIHFTRGPSDATPTPLTSLNSSGFIAIAAATEVVILDCTGIARTMINCWGFDDPLSNNVYAVYEFIWDGAFFKRISSEDNGGMKWVTSDVNKTLSLRNNNAFGFTKTYWTVKFIRLE